MPDWVVHLGFAYVMARLIKMRDLKLFFLGSLIPDISRIGLYFANFFQLNQISSHSYFVPFHTPLMAALVASVISLFSSFIDAVVTCKSETILFIEAASIPSSSFDVTFTLTVKFLFPISSAARAT